MIAYDCIWLPCWVVLQVEDEGGASSKAKEIDIKKMDLEDLKAEIYRRESATEEKEMELMVKKNERRREKIIERCAACADGI